MPEREPLRVLELRSVRGTGGGPEKTILLGAAVADRLRVQVTVCYVRDARDHVFHIDQRAAALGVNYVEVHERHSLDPSVWRQLQQIVRERRIQLVHSHDYKTDLLAWLVRRRGLAEALATAHGWTGHSARERYVYYPGNKRLLARFPLVVAVSSDIRSELVAHGADPARVHVLLNAIDPTTFRRTPAETAAVRASFGLNAGDLVVGAVGRLEPQKRYDLLIEAAASLRLRFPDLRLLIAGEGSARGDLERLIAARGLEGCCALAGHVGDIRPFHHALDLFVQSSEYEGTPNVVLEAMAMETPIVATAAGGTAEVCRPDVDGIIVPTGDSHGLSAAIARVLDDEAGRLARVRSARRRVEHELSFARRVRVLEELYESLAGSRVAA